MSFTIIRLPDEPIIIVTVVVPLEQDLKGLTNASTELARLVTSSRIVLYIVVDLRDQSLSFSDILIGIDLLADPNCWLMQPRAHPILLGNHPVIGLAIKRFRQQLGVTLHHVATMEEALAYARAQIASGRT